MFDRLMQGCLQTGAKCILDIHNYGRWNGQIVGQGGPSADQFANLWGQLAGKYQASPNVVMGLMNEPHEVDINTWAQAVQAAVNAIRQAGANTQMILLPGESCPIPPFSFRRKTTIRFQPPLPFLHFNKLILIFNQETNGAQ